MTQLTLSTRIKINTVSSIDTTIEIYIEDSYLIDLDRAGITSKTRWVSAKDSLSKEEYAELEEASKTLKINWVGEVFTLEEVLPLKAQELKDISEREYRKENPKFLSEEMVEVKQYHSNQYSVTSTVSGKALMLGQAAYQMLEAYAKVTELEFAGRTFKSYDFGTIVVQRPSDQRNIMFTDLVKDWKNLVVNASQHIKEIRVFKQNWLLWDDSIEVRLEEREYGTVAKEEPVLKRLGELI
jgi:hypothetical protein